MSMTIKTVSIGVTSSALGSLSALLGNMSGLTGEQWLLIIGTVNMAIIAGSLAALGQVFASPNATQQGKRSALIRAGSVYLAQFLIAMAFAQKVQGDIWLIIPFGLMIGWTGAAFLKRLAEKSGLTPDE